MPLDTSPHTRNTALWLFLVAMAALILCAPFADAVFAVGDEGVLLHAAERILQGRKLYVDFFEFLPPGGFVLTAGWLGTFGTTLWSARCLAILTNAGIACFTYLACRRVARHAPLSALIAIAWVIMTQGIGTQVSHHWLTTLFSTVTMWATLVAIDDRERPLHWLGLAGLAAGFAAMTTPHRGALVMLAGAMAIIIRWRAWRELTTYVAACLVIPALLVAQLLVQGAFLTAFEDVIIWPLTRYRSMQGVPFAHWTNPQSYPLSILFPLLAVLTVLACARHKSTGYSATFPASCLFALAGFVGCYPRPDAVHIGFSAPLAFPLLVECCRQLTRTWSPFHRLVVTAAATGACVATLLTYSNLVREAWRTAKTTTPKGTVRFLDTAAAGLVARVAATPLTDAYAFYPYMPLFPFLTSRDHVPMVDIFLAHYTSPAQYEEACRSAMQRAIWLVTDTSWKDPKAVRTIYPAMPDAEPQEKANFEQALLGAFALVAREGRYELRRRTPFADPRSCAGIARSN